MGHAFHTLNGRTDVCLAEGAAVIRVLLVHDVCLVRSVLAEWLRREPGLRVDDTPWHGARVRVRAVRPDVCAADLDSSGTHGVPPLADLRPVNGMRRGTQ